MNNRQKTTLMKYALIALVIYLVWRKMSSGYSVNGFTRVAVGLDHAGNDIKEVKGVAQACAIECKKTPGCKGFVRAPTLNNCWLKSAFSLGVPMADRNTFMLEV